MRASFKEPGTGEVPERLRKRANVVSRFSDSTCSGSSLVVYNVICIMCFQAQAHISSDSAAFQCLESFPTPFKVQSWMAGEQMHQEMNGL